MPAWRPSSCRRACAPSTGYVSNPTTGRISGKSMRILSTVVTVLATHATGATGAAKFTWTV